MLKKELDCATQRGWGIAIGLVIGGLIGFVIGGVSSSWAIVAGAKWWEVMTAFGTVGAVVVAVWLATRTESHGRRKSKVEAIVYVWQIYPQLGHLNEFLCNSLHTIRKKTVKKQEFISKNKEFLDWLESLEYLLILEFHKRVCINCIQTRNALNSLDAMFSKGHWVEGVIETKLKDLIEINAATHHLIKTYDGDKYLV